MKAAAYLDDRDVPSILVIDDEVSNLKVLNQILEDDYDILTAQNWHDALEIAANEKPDLILLDVVMPEVDGFELMAMLRVLPETAGIPIIFITAQTGEEKEERGLKMGAADYIMKPFRTAVVHARVEMQMMNVKQRREIERLSMTDPLTGIPNRRGFDIHLEMEWAHAIRERLPISVLMLDVDHFKDYNDTYGHPQGDAILKAVANIIQASVKRAGDIAARIGGEEFAVLLPNTELGAALAVAERMRAEVEASNVPTQDGKPTSATVSIGAIAERPSPNSDASLFVAKADGCLYVAKESGRNCVFPTRRAVKPYCPPLAVNGTAQ